MAAQTLDSDHEKWLIMDDRTDGDDLDNILSEQRRELMAAKTLDSDPEKRPIMDDWTDGDDLDNIRSEQRRELMAAQTLDSDLEMAFKLQMQEAMTASLALVPSSSSHNSPPPSPPHDCSNDAALDIAAALMLEDVERFAQELEDHERTVLEMMKAKEDLSRRIHDQKFAVELRDVPEDYWAQHGRCYERPYCTDGASSSKPAVVVETENLRLYCKGLVSEEMVRDVKSVVAGVGVAVCDPMDNLIFEARKNLEAVVDGVVLSNEAAELEAIIEGLNNALDLDLEAVTFFCDDYMIYQYDNSVRLSWLVAIFGCMNYWVTNRVQPGNSKVATLVNQVALLQKKFEYCSPSLVARSDIKFALKIAREAIVSQITWQAETSEGKSLKETCVICFEEIDVAEMFTIDGCLHSCAKFLAPKLVEAISQRIKESAIPVTDKVPWHFNMNCYDYKLLNPNPRPEDQLLNSLAKKKHWRQCIKCSNMVELAEGCYHITCSHGKHNQFNVNSHDKHNQLYVNSHIKHNQLFVNSKHIQLYVNSHGKHTQLYMNSHDDDHDLYGLSDYI
ncbi:unnamed protein product [Malus baccata var. baccata]